MPLHKDLDTGEIHQIDNATYATRADREAATYATSDVGRVVKQTDEGSYWLVKSTTPTFQKVSGPEGEQTDTTDATGTSIWSFTMPENSALSVEARVTAMESDGSDRNYYHIAGLFYRNGGNATQQGSTATIVTPIESDATPTVEFSVSGTDVRLRWNGIAGENWVVIPNVTYDLVI